MNIYTIVYKTFINLRLNVIYYNTLFFIFFLFLSQFVNATLAGYSKTSTVTINNTANASNLADFQVLISFNSSELIANGELKSDGSDLRFLDSDDSTSLPYWIESGINIENTKVWVKIPSIPASAQKTIHMYYNNPSASNNSNGGNTFDFFDSFDSFNAAIWSKTYASIDVSNSKLIVTNGAAYTSSPIFSSTIDKMIESNITYKNSIGSYSGFMIGNDNATAGSNTGSDALVYYMTQSSNDNMMMSYWAADGTINNYNLGSGNLFTASLNTSYIFGMVITSNNSIKFLKDYSEILSRTGTWDAPFYIWIGYFIGSVSGSTDIKNMEIDWIRVRKYTANPPSTIVNFPIAKLVFTKTPQTIIKNYVEDSFIIETQNINGNAQEVAIDTTLTLSSNSATGEFSTAASPFIPVTEILLPSGSSSVSFYYRDSETGTKTITVSENPSQSWTSANKIIQVITYSGQSNDEDLSEWLYNGILKVNNPSSSTLTDFQIMLELNTEELINDGKMNPLGNDIRFMTSDKLTPLPYWIESGINTPNTKIWIKVPTLLSGNNEFQFYYGNFSAPAISNGISTFDFFDDFDSFNTSIWSKTYASIDVLDSKLILSNGAAYTSSPVLSSTIDKMIEANITYKDSTGSYSGFMIGNDNSTAGSNTESDALLYYMTQSGNGNMMMSYWAADGTINNYNLGSGNLFTASLNTPYIFGMVITSNNSIKFLKNYSEILSRTGTWNAPFYIWTGYFIGKASSSTDIKDMEIDWIRVRKYFGFDAITSIELSVTKLGFSTPEQNIFEDRTSSMIVIKSLNDILSEQIVSRDTLIHLSTTSPTGEFSLLSSPFISITEVLIPLGSSSTSFYYKDALTGTYQLSIAEIPDEGLEDATQNITVLPVNSAGTYRQRITITNTLPITLNEYQISLTLDTASLIAAGQMKNDGSDILFFDDDDLTILPYWIESGIDTATTKIWIKVPNIPNGEKDIFIYYGNPSAIASQNGVQTFDFFDDFESFNPTVWEKTDIGIDVSTSKAIISNGALYTKTPQLPSSSDEIVESKMKWTSSNGSYSGLMISNDKATAGSNTESDALVYYMTQSSNGDMMLSYWAANGLASNYNLGSGSTSIVGLDTNTILGLSTTTSNSIKIFRNYTNVITRTGTWSAPSYIWVGYFTGAAAGSTSIKPIEVDWVRSRKYASIEPTTFLNSQENVVSQIVFTTSEKTLSQDQSSEILTLQTQALNGMPVNVSSNTQIDLITSSLGGRFSLQKTNWIDISSVIIPNGQNSISFYYRDTLTGSHIIKAEETPSKGWIDATQTVTITRRIIAFTSQPKMIIQEAVSTPITVETRDVSGNQIPLGRDTVFNLTSSSSTGEFSLYSSPFIPINNITVPMNQNSFNFYYRDKTTGVHSITISETPSQNWIQATQNITIIPATDYFEVTANDKVVAGEPFDIKIIAKKADGTIFENYSGRVSIITDYIDPNQGTYSIFPNIATDFKKGVLELSSYYDDAGIISCTVIDTDNNKIIGTSNQILVFPNKFEIKIDSLNQIVAKPFGLKITALNIKGEITPNFIRTVNLDAIQLPENISYEIELYPQSVSFQLGIAELENVSFNDFGNMKIKVIDPLNTIVANENLSDEIFFHPAGFHVNNTSPPIKRNFYYLNEVFNVEISPYDYNFALIPSYTGEVIIEKTEGLSIPSSHTFIEDNYGKLILEANCYNEAEFAINIYDKNFIEARGKSETIKSKYAYITVESKDLPLQESSLYVYINDKENKIITDDYSTTLTISLIESNPNESASLKSYNYPIKIEGGTGVFSISNKEEETVKIIPEATPYLDIKEGIIKFIKNAVNVGKGGLRILFWKEVRD